MTDDDYYTIRSAEALTGKAGRPSPLRVASLFAAVAVALAVVTIQRSGDDEVVARAPLNLDPIATGSIDRAPGAGYFRRSRSDGQTYVVRRSVLTGGSICVIASDGSRSGNC